MNRIERESHTILAMLNLYCQGNHHRDGISLCPECQGLAEYAQDRLRKCPFQTQKTTCVKCPVHCYEPGMRRQVREVMRYSGPKMLTHFPMLTVLHLIDGLRKPVQSKR